MPSLAQLLNAKLASSKLAVTKAAKVTGISFPSFHAVLKGHSQPNSRSVDKYARFLGITSAEVSAAAGRTSTKSKAANSSRGRPKGKGRRGRPPGAKNKVKSGGRSTAQARALNAALAQAVTLLNKVAKGLRRLT